MQTHTQALPGTDLSFKMIKVEGGVFEMGGKSWDKDSLPVHTVELSDYWIGQFPVTQQLWEAVLGKKSNESYFKGRFRPVERVSWEQINNEFLPALNELTRKNRPGATTYQLPTEAQWEYAARGGASIGSATRSFEYAGSNKLDDVGWYDENCYGETKPVGLKLPNELGLFDMSGNVWEWCRDWYGSDYYKNCKDDGVVPNPKGPETGNYRVLRGGCWNYYPQFCRVSYRIYYHPTLRNFNIGFRLVLVSLPAHGKPDSFH